MRSLVLIAVFTTGCGPDEGGGGGATSSSESADGDGCALGGEPTLVIGTGESAFEAVEDTVELVHGPQGGYHVYVSLEATHIDNSEFATGLIQGTIDDAVVAQTQPWLDFRCNPDTQTLQTWGTLLIYPLQPPELDHQQTTITADVTAADVEVSASLVTTIIDPLL